MMTINLEKTFFNWILLNPKYFKRIEYTFYESKEIAFIYKCIQEEYLNSKDKIVPSHKEITNIVKEKDLNDIIPNDFIKQLLKWNRDEFRDDYIKPRFKAWMLSNAGISGMVDGFEIIKNLDKSNIIDVESAITKIKNIIDDSFITSDDNDSLGLDFDDPDAHDQDTLHNKITSGYTCFDTITNGGFDRKTLSILMGQPSSGKSLWLQNLAVNAVNAGYNVAYITLELSDKKALKRIGSMRLEIPINEYDKFSKDKEYMSKKIQEMNERGDSVFTQKNGKLFIKEYPSGSATLSDIEAYLKRLKDEVKIDIDLLCVDYIQIMGTEKGVDRNMLYLKGDHLAVGLRAIAQKYDLACLTATQIAKEKYNANDMALNDMPESKAMADTADMVWGIIQNPLMKLEGKYHLKHLKLRDCSTDYERIGFDFNKQYLRVHSDYYIDSTLR